MGPESDGYLALRLRDSLGADPRVNELGISVRIQSGRVWLSGEVATEARREAVGRVAGEVLPGHEVHNGVEVATLRDADRVEHLS